MLRRKGGEQIDNESTKPIGWKAFSVLNPDGTPHMVPERTYDPVCPPANDIGGPKERKDGFSIDTDTLETDARCWPWGSPD